MQEAELVEQFILNKHVGNVLFDSPLSQANLELYTVSSYLNLQNKNMGAPLIEALKRVAPGDIIISFDKNCSDNVRCFMQKNDTQFLRLLTENLLCIEKNYYYSLIIPLYGSLISSCYPQAMKNINNSTIANEVSMKKNFLGERPKLLTGSELIFLFALFNGPDIKYARGLADPSKTMGVFFSAELYPEITAQYQDASVADGDLVLFIPEVETSMFSEMKNSLLQQNQLSQITLFISNFNILNKKEEPAASLLKKNPFALTCHGSGCISGNIVYQKKKNYYLITIKNDFFQEIYANLLLPLQLTMNTLCKREKPQILVRKSPQFFTPTPQSIQPESLINIPFILRIILAMLARPTHLFFKLVDTISPSEDDVDEKGEESRPFINV